MTDNVNFTPASTTALSMPSPFRWGVFERESAQHLRLQISRALPLWCLQTNRSLPGWVA